MSATVAEIEPKKEISVTPEEHVQTVKSFMHTCMRVTFKKTGLPRSKRASTQAVERVAEEAEGDVAAFSVGKRLLSCGHAVVDRVNHWARKVEKLRNVYTFPMAASEGVDAGTLSKARGDRLVRVDDVDDFEQGLLILEEEGLGVSEELYQRYDEVMALEKKRLGKEFNPSDYPPRDGVVRYVECADGPPRKVPVLRIGKRSYTDVKAPARLPRLVLERMTVETAELMNQSVEVAVTDLAKVLCETFETLARALVDRVRIRPKYGTEAYKKFGAEAEVLAVRTRQEDPNLAEGARVLTVTWKDGKKMVKEDFGPVSEDEYEALRPEPMEATKKVDSRVVERFGTFLDTFRDLHKKLGAYGEHLDGALDALRGLQHEALKGKKSSKDNAETLIDHVKRSSGYRHKLRTALEDVGDTVQAVAVEVKRVRRRLQGSIAAQVKDKLL